MNFADRLKKRERYSHVRENEHGMTLIEYMTVNFPRFNRCEWLEKINSNSLLINGKTARVVGRVCMDQVAIDVTDIDGVKAGDEVILFGKGLPVDEVAELCGTISYELLCGVSKRVPRIEIK